MAKSRLITDERIDPSKVILVPGLNEVRFMTQEEVVSGHNWEDMHSALKNLGFAMPKISEFMKFFLTIIDAYENEKPLYDGNKKPLSRKQIKDLYYKLTGSKSSGTNTFLNAYANERNGGFYLDCVKSPLIGSNLLFTPQGRLEQMATGKEIPVYATLKFNEQGLPMEKSPHQRSMRGKNLAYYPCNRGLSVGAFSSDSNHASLELYLSPLFKSSNMGSFGITDGKSFG